MPKLYLPITLLLALNSCGLSAMPLAQHQVIKVCGQIAEWPPYLYFKRNEGVKSTEVTGYSIDYLQRSLASHGLGYTIDMLPWKRCMESVRRGIYDMMTDTSNNEERARNYLVSKPYYAMHLVYFYDRERPKPDVHTSADLRKLRLCAVNGYNYAGFGLKAEEIETGSQNLGQSFLKLKHNRCDAMPERLEIARGYKALAVVDFEKLNIGFSYLPDLSPSDFHMMVSKNIPYGKELLDILDENIEKINDSAASREISAKYSIPGVDLTRSLPGRSTKNPIK